MGFEVKSDTELRKTKFSHKVSKGRLVIGLALLMLVSCSVLIGYKTVYQPYMRGMYSTATVEARIQMTAQVKATHAAQFSATLTAQTIATATSVARHQKNFDEITSTFPDINDDLHTPDTYNWDTGSGCSFVNSSYSSVVSQRGFFLPCIAKKTQLQNFVYQVDMKIITGDAGGLIIRAREDNSRSYIFVVGQDGSYSIYYYSGDDRKAAQTLSDGYSNQINTGYKQVNTIGVLASGSSLDFYINKKYVTSVIDNTLSNGQIGVLANSYKNPTEVFYSHARIWKL
ncbi:hypothetical protein [Dictyobacter kobayashii]|uniref:3-keto-disaccharide hydrolase domain-containing protein n=1 Tax=Dictyobacter kobayashii TaxID=2014872 RepID=A0A402AKU0_9CHLR|nr:hypothetical protein [Dictyobacter kobayashii]GCE19645.1 hypothetical protein KDK_34450 [Dictyobacter kobayashii]